MQEIAVAPVPEQKRITGVKGRAQHPPDKDRVIAPVMARLGPAVEACDAARQRGQALGRLREVEARELCPVA